MKFRRFSLAAAVLCGSLFAAGPLAAGEPKAVIELFTSQGCSSCPPADKLLGELAHDPSIIAMSLPIDYWDYLGWKDTLALHGHSNRQRAYSIVRGDRAVYTPQAVVNGVVHALGSDKAAIEEAIVKSHTNKAALSLPVTLKVEDGKVVVNVPGAEGENGLGEVIHAEVWLCPITDKIKVTVARGENRGQTLTYSNVVRRWLKLGVWTGKPETFTVPLSDIPNANYTLADVDRVAVLVQDGITTEPGVMVGAAAVALK